MSRRKAELDDTDLRGLVTDKLRWLRLPGMAGAIEDVIDQANDDNLSSLDVVSRL